MKWTEALVIEALWETFLLPEGSQAMDEWALLTQVPLRALTATGERVAAAGGKVKSEHWNERIIDALAVRCWSGGPGHTRYAFEVKVSRPDFRNETDEKRAPAEASAHLCAYVAPAGLLRPDEMPHGWGLAEVHETREFRPERFGPRVAWAKKPKRRTPTCDLDYLVSAGFRRASRAEREIRLGDVPAAEVARLRHEAESLHGIAARAKDAVRRADRRVRMLRSEILSLAGDQLCADCGEKVTWKIGGQHDSSWIHVDKAHEPPCRKIRIEADRQRKMRETGAHYNWGMDTPIEPRAIREMRAAEQEMETAS